MYTLQTIRIANRVIGELAPNLTARIARRMLMTPRVGEPREWERAAAARAERVTFRFGLSGLRWGQSGPVVLAMHGWSGRATQFAAFVDPLVASGRQVIALDAPAHGNSPGRESNVFGFTEAILEAAAEIRGLESAIGHSMGGAAALYARHLGLPVGRVATIGAPASLERVLSRFADWLALPVEAKARFVDAVDRHVGVPAAAIDAERIGPAAGVGGLVVHDRDDREVPYGEAEALVRAWPAAQLFTTQGLGHSRILSDPAVVRETVAFLTTGDARQIAA
jgi:pimeloyl-ACP methyl ester carboxylesterase